jgi:beta-galactosidase GanA
LYYGGDYNPEQWPEEVWPEDIRRMQEAGVNFVSLAIFSWAKIQPSEGEFEWGWLDRIMDLLHEGGIQVNLATATASPPPWATQKYPEMLPRDENGAVYGPGSRQHYAPTSPAYRRLAAELVSAIASRYAKHPAVVMWHVNNEYGCHVNYDYSDNARNAFQEWLQRKYRTIEALNAVWGTTFWSQIYTSFDQILPPSKAPTGLNPGGALDFKRFTSDALLELYVMERDIIKAAGATQPVSTNFMGAFPPLDYWRWAQEIDVITDDCYPDPNDPESFRAAAFARGLTLPQARNSVAVDGTIHRLAKLAAHQRSEGAWTDGRPVGPGRGPRRRRNHVLPVEASAARQRKIPLRHAAAGRYGHPDLARGHWARSNARRTPQHGLRQPRSGRGGLRLGKLVGPFTHGPSHSA